jgi:hypothetical protein
MDRNSRNAMDRMTREIRRAGDLIEFSSTHLKFVGYGQTNSFLVYDWDANSRQLTEWKTGQAMTNVLLSECDNLAFNMSRDHWHPPRSFRRQSDQGQLEMFANNFRQKDSLPKIWGKH